MFRSVKKGKWLIGYRIHHEKIIELVNAVKDFEQKGWSESRGGHVDGSSGRS